MFNNIISKGKFTLALALSLAIALFVVVGSDQRNVPSTELNNIPKKIVNNISETLLSHTTFCMSGGDRD